MTLPALEKTWVHTTGDLSPVPSTNLQVLAQGSIDATNRAVLLAIVSALLTMSGGAKFVCMGSSNGTTADAAGSVSTSKWTAVADLVSRDAGGLHSWIVLAYGDGSAAAPQILLDLDKTWHDSFRDGVRIVISPSGAFTGGDASNAPTATDAVLVYSHDSRWNQLGADRNHRVNVGATDDRSGVFVVTMSDGAIQTGFYLGTAKNPVSTGWAQPWLWWLTSGVDCFKLATFNLTTKLGGDVIPLYPTGECYFPAGDGTRYTIPLHFNTDDQSGEYPLGPIGLYSPTAGKRGRKGSIFDLFWGLSTNGLGDTYPGDDSRTRAQFGHLVFPWDGSSVETV